MKKTSKKNQAENQLSDQHLDRRIGEIEHALHRDDPSLERRMKKLDRANTRDEVAVFALLIIGAVLLAAAFATLSVVVGLGGVAAYLASFVVDRRRRRRLRDDSTLDQDPGRPSGIRHQSSPAAVTTMASTSTSSTTRALAVAIHD